MKYTILKNGTTDAGIVESNPVIFHDQVWMCKSIRSGCGKHRFGSRCGFFFRNMDTGVETPFIDCSGFGHCAYSTGDHVIVTFSLNGAIWQTDSDDLIHWTEPRLILKGEGWHSYNTSVCKSGNRYVMVFELGAPAELVGEPFTMFFAESEDLKEWKVIPGASFGKAFYTGSPMLRYFAPWFYFFYLHGTYEEGFVMWVVRSKDLKNWEFAPLNPVLDYQLEGDRLLNGTFSAEELLAIRTAQNYNNSDLDMSNWNGQLLLAYSWGNQMGNEFLATATVKCSEKEFCESFFPEKQ